MKNYFIFLILVNAVPSCSSNEQKPKSSDSNPKQEQKHESNYEISCLLPGDQEEECLVYRVEKSKEEKNK